MKLLSVLNLKIKSFTIIGLFLPLFSFAQSAKVFTHADTLRGSITPERAWWDVERYDITVKPDYNSKTISGENVITYKVVKDSKGIPMQIDLQEPLIIDSIFLNGHTQLSFSQEGNAWHVKMPDQKRSSSNTVSIFYSGKVHEAVNPPWSGGWIWTKDSLGRPWMTVTCQGTGASVWYPCKDHQSDEPDKGASLTMIVPDTLMAVANGRMQFKKNNGDGTTSYKWAVVNPISNYCIIPYIGKYVDFKEVYKGEKGNLDIHYWALDYHQKLAESYMPPEVHKMLKAFEYWFGPYPFYEDGYQLIETSHTGMEHQSAVAYGNHFAYGYRGRDLAGNGLGLKWDFIIVHESAHEWFGNNITTKDLADMWVHESFANYAETLYVDYYFGKKAGNEYNLGIRKGIKNDRPIIAKYNVNEEGSGDMYDKGGNMLHSIRHSMDNDTKFRSILRGLNTAFYHQTVTTGQIENYISEKAAFNYNKVFDQYLRTTQMPVFEYYLSGDHQRVFYRYTNCVKGFNLPLTLQDGHGKVKILPTGEWKSYRLKKNESVLFDKSAIEAMYCVTVVAKDPTALIK